MHSRPLLTSCAREARFHYIHVRTPARVSPHLAFGALPHRLCCAATRTPRTRKRARPHPNHLPHPPLRLFLLTFSPASPTCTLGPLLLLSIPGLVIARTHTPSPGFEGSLPRQLTNSLAHATIARFPALAKGACVQSQPFPTLALHLSKLFPFALPRHPYSLPLSLVLCIPPFCPSFLSSVPN